MRDDQIASMINRAAQSVLSGYQDIIDPASLHPGTFAGAVRAEAVRLMIPMCRIEIVDTSVFEYLEGAWLYACELDEGLETGTEEYEAAYAADERHDRAVFTDGTPVPAWVKEVEIPALTQDEVDVLRPSRTIRHCWIHAAGMNYDAETPEGVANPCDLPSVRHGLIEAMLVIMPGRLEALVEEHAWWAAAIAAHGADLDLAAEGSTPGQHG